MAENKARELLWPTDTSILLRFVFLYVGQGSSTIILVKDGDTYKSILVDINLDSDLLAERVNSDLIRHIQFSRKKNSFRVGEEIQLSLAAEEPYLEEYLNNNKDSISEIVNAKHLDITKG